MEIIHIKNIKDMQFGKFNIVTDESIPEGEIHFLDKKQPKSE